MQTNSEVILGRDCDAVQIPSGLPSVIPAGTRVTITQSLGGSYTVRTDWGLVRINDENADALGLTPAPKPADAARSGEEGPVSEKALWDQLKTCYDPEIPVNIVDLGLVYDCRISSDAASVGSKVDVKMTLTAPGCGMGPTLAAEARGKLLTVPGVSDAEVELVWDPPWNPNMISEAGKMKLGMI